MKKVVVTALAAAAITVAIIYGRWIVSDLLWLHQVRVESDRQAAFLAGQQDAVRQIKAAQSK